MIGVLGVLGLAALGSWTLYSSLRSHRDSTWRARHERLLAGSGLFGDHRLAAPALRWMWLLGAGLLVQAAFLAVWLTVQSSSFTPSTAFAQVILAGFLSGCALVVGWLAVVSVQGRGGQPDRTPEENREDPVS